MNAPKLSTERHCTVCGKDFTQPPVFPLQYTCPTCKGLTHKERGEIRIQRTESEKVTP